MTEPLADRPGPSAGELLRAAREKQGLHIAALAAAIKVAPRKLDALENDRWQELPDATFARALAQTVCRTLKIDARPILERLPAAATVALEPTGGVLNQPFRDRPGRSAHGWAGTLARPIVWAPALLLTAALALYVLPVRWWSVAAPDRVAASAPAASAALATESLAPTLLAGVPAAADPQPAGETVFAAPPPALAATAPAAAGLVLLTSSEPSWVDVRDAAGQVLFSRTVQPGETVGLDGKLPIRLTIGNATATRVAFRGRTVDLASSVHENVARIELQ
jgi:cytoskeleton protein RodZ